MISLLFRHPEERLKQPLEPLITSLFSGMVRIIAGTLAEIGEGRLGEDSFLHAFETGCRLSLGMTAPAYGLELTEVRYPDSAFDFSSARPSWITDPLTAPHEGEYS